MHYMTLEVGVDWIYDYTPEEQRTHDHPGYPAAAEVYGASIEGNNLTTPKFKAFWAALPENVRYRIETEIIEHEEEKARDAAEYRDESRREAVAEGTLFHFGAGLMRMQDKLRG